MIGAYGLIVNPLTSVNDTGGFGFGGRPGNCTVTVCGPRALVAGMVIELVTCNWLTWTLPVPVMVPTVTLLMGAVCGGGFDAGSRLIVSVNVVPRAALVGDTLKMPPPVLVPPS